MSDTKDVIFDEVLKACKRRAALSTRKELASLRYENNRISKELKKFERMKTSFDDMLREISDAAFELEGIGGRIAEQWEIRFKDVVGLYNKEEFSKLSGRLKKIVEKLRAGMKQ